MKRVLAILMTGLCGVGSALAETAYVTDMLRLGVHRAEDTSDEAFVYLNSGDALEVLERNRFYARVRLPTGEVGWVRGAYLVDEEPARRRVNQLEQERDTLASELETLKATVSDRLARLDELEAEAKARAEASRGERAELEDLRSTNTKLTRSLQRYRFSVPVNWLLGAILSCLLAGSLGTWWWLDRRSRRRHGGFRIY